MDRQSRFRLRPFISLLSGFSFIVLVCTGIVLFITPPGRVANWTGWTFWRLTKHEWIDLHLCFSVLFLLACLVHLWLNIRPLMQYFVKTMETARRLRWEPPAAVLVCGIVFWGALKPFGPFSSFLNLNERIKFSWEKPTQQAPIPHAELLTIEELARDAEIETGTILENLNAYGIKADVSYVFGDIAEKNGLSPDALFKIATGAGDASDHGERGGGQGGRHGGGFGQKTLEAVCREMGIDPQEAMNALNAAGIEATWQMQIRTIAEEHNVHPSQIRRILENQ